MVDKRLIELSDKLSNGEIDIQQYGKTLEIYGYHPNSGAGWTMEAFEAEWNERNKKKKFANRLINFFKSLYDYRFA